MANQEILDRQTAEHDREIGLARLKAQLRCINRKGRESNGCKREVLRVEWENFRVEAS